MKWFEGSTDEQIAYLEAFLQNKENSIWKYYLISLYFENEMNDKAKPLCEEILEENPYDLIASIILAKIYFSLLQPRDAKKVLLTAYQKNMDNLVLIKMLADIEAELQNYAEALNLYEEAMKIDAQNESIIDSVNKMKELVALNQPDELERRSENNEQVLGLDQRELHEIKQVFQEIHQLSDDKDVKISEKLALKYEEKGMWKEASEVYWSLAEQYPKNENYKIKHKETQTKGG